MQSELLKYPQGESMSCRKSGQLQSVVNFLHWHMGLECGTRNVGPGTWDWNVGPGTWDWNAGPGTWDWNVGPGTWDWNVGLEHGTGMLEWKHGIGLTKLLGQKPGCTYSLSYSLCSLEVNLNTPSHVPVENPVLWLQTPIRDDIRTVRTSGQDLRPVRTSGQWQHQRNEDTRTGRTSGQGGHQDREDIDIRTGRTPGQGGHQDREDIRRARTSGQGGHQDREDIRTGRSPKSQLLAGLAILTSVIMLSMQVRNPGHMQTR